MIFIDANGVHYLIVAIRWRLAHINRLRDIVIGSLNEGANDVGIIKRVEILTSSYSYLFEYNCNAGYTATLIFTNVTLLIIFCLSKDIFLILKKITFADCVKKCSTSD
jgi:hypothetical protein